MGKGKYFLKWCKFGFVGMFDGMLLSTPHPPPAAGAGRHLPPKGKAFRGDPRLSYTQIFVFLCDKKRRTVSSGSLPPRGKVSPSKCGGRRMRGRDGSHPVTPIIPNLKIYLSVIISNAPSLTKFLLCKQTKNSQKALTRFRKSCKIENV